MRFQLIALMLCVAITGCSKEEESIALAPSPLQAKSSEAPGRFMANEHSIALDVEDSRVTSVYQAVESGCLQASEEQCVILESSLNTGRHVSAAFRVRAKPEGIRKIIAGLNTQGEVIRQSLSAEDLAAPIEDSAKKLEMLNDYRSKLETLRGKASNDVDALIKVNKELAQVQSDIEALTGERAHLIQRVETEILNITISSKEGSSFWRPITNALSDFSRNLSDAISSAITAVALIIPWGILFLLFGWVGRKVWLRSKRRMG